MAGSSSSGENSIWRDPVNLKNPLEPLIKARDVQGVQDYVSVKYESFKKRRIELANTNAHTQQPVIFFSGCMCVAWDLRSADENENKKSYKIFNILLENVFGGECWKHELDDGKGVTWCLDGRRMNIPPTTAMTSMAASLTTSLGPGYIISLSYPHSTQGWLRWLRRSCI